jgi:hypothetical protein
VNLSTSWRVAPGDKRQQDHFMSRNTLYAVIAVLAVAVAGFAIYYFYQESQKPGLEIRLEDNRISVNGNG